MFLFLNIKETGRSTCFSLRTLWDYDFIASKCAFRLIHHTKSWVYFLSNINMSSCHILCDLKYLFSAKNNFPARDNSVLQEWGKGHLQLFGCLSLSEWISLQGIDTSLSSFVTENRKDGKWNWHPWFIFICPGLNYLLLVTVNYGSGNASEAG